MGKCEPLHRVILRVGSSVQLCRPGSRALLTVRVGLGTGLCLGEGSGVTPAPGPLGSLFGRDLAVSVLEISLC